jgi:DNA-binding transcriptional ArsR family regulator
MASVIGLVAGVAIVVGAIALAILLTRAIATLRRDCDRILVLLATEGDLTGLEISDRLRLRGTVYVLLARLEEHGLVIRQEKGPPIAVRGNRPRVFYSVAKGCLGCNKDAIVRTMTAIGIDPTRFVQVPPSRHAWNDVAPCSECGRQWLIEPKEKS